MKLYDELLWRNMIKDCNNNELAKDKLNNNKVRFYIGFDPTGKSLTIGHFVQIMRMKLLEKHGHTPIILIGGATGLIGDPRETTERKLLPLKESLKNAELIKKQMLKFFDEKNVIFVNNYHWVKNIDVITFLRDYGKEFSINYMLAKDTVAKRLETGISYTEFSYMLLQAIDFLKLYEDKKCEIQFGGSDQWGNISTGLELIRKRHPNNEVVGMTSPLLLKSDGQKFGKSESGTVWIDEKLTTPYELYQYFYNATDSDVINYLKFLTLISPEEIMKLEEQTRKEPHKRYAQIALADYVVEFIHGKRKLNSAKKVTEALFSGDFSKLTKQEFEMLAKSLDAKKINDSQIGLINAITLSGLAKSNREAREFIKNNAITLNNEKTTDVNKIVTKKDSYFNTYVVLKRGRKKFSVLKF